ncbi:hypothetical protein FACS1894179_08490 [Bacteroidia bacterium]|nr:hypothetical protein FACS1894169_14280 [Bacteroidia bacterium]GHV41020.1 hypothetical protein FACS1894179_08490 [Bacteroidia bacterium]
MRKLTRSDVDTLRKELPVLDEAMQKSIYGGCGNYGSPPIDAYIYSIEEYGYMLGSGSWTGGFVEGMGYVGGQVVVMPFQYFNSAAEYVNSLSTDFWDSGAAGLIDKFVPGSGMYRDYFNNQQMQCVSGLFTANYNGAVYINVISSPSGSYTDLSTVIEVYNATTGQLVYRSNGNW